MHANEDVDIVITWVDGSDPVWQEDYKKYTKKTYDFARYEDTGTLKYIFRGLEAFMPWVRKVHLVTYGHLPEWLDADHPMLNIVKHCEIIAPENLPTFNSRNIEMAFLNIPDLSEKFIYFNDDTLVVKPLGKSRFFKNDLPVDNIRLCALHYDGMFTHTLHEMSSIIQKEMALMTKLEKIKLCLSIKYSIRRNLRNLMFILGGDPPNFTFYHFPQAHLKSNIQSFHEDYAEKAAYTLRQKFRTPFCCNNFVFRFLGLVRNKFYPDRDLKDTMYILYDSADSLEQQIKDNFNDNTALLCFGESERFEYHEYDRTKEIIPIFLDSILGSKSSYEKQFHKDRC